MPTLSSPVTVLRGVGNVRAAAFEKLGIRTLRDLLYHFPRAYEDRGHVLPVSAAEHGMTAAFRLTVGNIPSNARLRGGMIMTKFHAFDGTGGMDILYFNQPYRKETFLPGEEYRFYGKVNRKKNVLMLSSPVAEKIGDDIPLRELVPVYPLSEGLTQKAVREAIGDTLRTVAAELTDELPDEVRAARQLCTLSYALRNIHLPQDTEALRRAAKRLSYDELFRYALAAGLSAKKQKAGRTFYMKDTDVSAFLSEQPFSLTKAQLRTVKEIQTDLGEPSLERPPMARIVIGDVGSGKTVCAAAAMYIAAKNGWQAALMAPTEILAEQHYHDLSPMFERFGMHVAFLSGSSRKSQKEKVKKGLLSNGEDRIDLLIGTHAILSEGVDFRALGLVITDEQHRFGVDQRTRLGEKGDRPHVLVMSATPIPRTLSLVMYHDIDVSLIDEMPAGRQRVDTFVVDESYRERLNGFIRRQVSEGGQVYIVCPTVEAKDTDGEEALPAVDARDILSLSYADAPPLKAAVDYAAELQNTVFPDIGIGFLHGQMKPREKEKTMAAFVRGEIKILVSTTVIEVGVNVPSASLMIVENAERFGLSTLHQLRGRVGRGNKKSYCVLVSDCHGEGAKERLGTLRRVYDGFAIAEKDLQMRGPGDFFALRDGPVRQSGTSPFRVSMMGADEQLMLLAFRDAGQLLERDPELTLPSYAALYRSVKEQMGERTAALN